MKNRYYAIIEIILVLGMSILAVACSDDGSVEVDSDGDVTTTDGDMASDCPPGYNCDPCTSDFDCDAGMICDMESGFCVPSVPDDGDVEIDGDKMEEDLAETDEPIDSDGRRIEVIPEVVDFGAVQWGQTVTEQLIVRNHASSSEELEIQEVQFLTEGDIDFTFKLWDEAAGAEVVLPKTLAPNESFKIKVTYAPSDEKDDLGEQLLISSNDAEAPIVRVDMEPQYKGQANLEVAPDPIAFENTPVYASAVIAVHLSNSPADEEANRVLKITEIYLQNGQVVDEGFQVMLPRLISEDDPVFLVPGASLDVMLEFSPQVMTDYNNSLFVVCNDPDDGPNVEIPISARGIQADLVVTPMPIDFGPRNIGESHTMAVEVLNVGNDEFPIDAIRLLDENPHFEIVSIEGAMPWLLLSGETGRLEIAFTPDQIEQTTDRLWIEGGETDEGEMKPDYFIDVMGEGSEAIIRLEPDFIDFGEVQHSQVAIETIRVFNDGSEDLLIDHLEMSTIGSADFNWVDVPEIYEAIPPTQSRFIDFSYSLDEGGNRSACLIFSNAGNSAEDGSYQIEMQASSSDPIFSINPNSIDFGEAEEREVETAAVQNQGTGVLTVYAVGVAVGSNPDFSVENFQKGGSAVTLPVELAQSEIFNFDVVYQPSSPGQATGAVSVVHNDYDLFEAGDSDRTEFNLVLNADGPMNHPPVAEIRVNEITENTSFQLGSILVVDDDGVYDDGVGSHDQDEGDTIVDWDFQIEPGTPDGHDELAGEGNIRSVSANVPGDWIFSLRVKDSFDAWSQKDTITIKVTTGPVAVLRINGYEESPPEVHAGTEVVLDGIPSYDPDGGNAADFEFEFRVDSAPPGADITLSGGPGPSRTILPRRLGTWSFGMRVRDDEGVWSGWDTLDVSVTKPETLNIVLSDVNWCVPGSLGYDLIFYNIDTPPDECGPSPRYVCAWGPTHSGECSGILHNDGASEIAWDYSELGGVYPDLDGEYRISVKPISLLNSETVKVSLYKDGQDSYYWRGTHYFNFLGNQEWNVYVRRIGGVWQDPHLCVPDGCN